MQKLNLSDIQKIAPTLDSNNISLYDFKVNICYDTYLASLYYRDFNDGYINGNVNLFFGSRQTDYLVIIENGVVAESSYYKKSKLSRMNKDELQGLNYYHDLIWNATCYSKNELIDNLLSVSNEEYYKNRYEKEDYQDLDFDFAVRGHSQGDYFKVKLLGNVEEWVNKDYLTNIFYDTPISGNIEVFKNGSLIGDFHLHGLANFNEYDSYDKDTLITMIADYCSDEDYKDLLIAYLDKNLSDTINYDY